MRLKLPIIWGVIMGGFTVFSQQQFSGFVFDMVNKEPLVGASVLIHELKKGTVTDVDGSYEISLPNGNYTVKVAYIGYIATKQQLVIANKNMNKTFYLEPSIAQIDEITITANSVAQEKREQPFQISVLDAKPLQVQSRPITGLVSQISGVRVREEGGMGSNVNIMLNGIGGKGVRIFVDDIPADLLGSGMAINNLPVNMIDHIEVYKGVIPAKFGSDALGGILNLVTRDIKKDYLDISTGMGSFGTYQASLNSRKYFGKDKRGYWGLSGFYNHSDNDYWMDDVDILEDELGNTGTGSVRRFNDAYTSYLGQTTWGIRNLSWANEIQFNLSVSHTNKEWQHGQSAEQAWGETFSEATDINSELKWKKWRMWNENLDASLNAGYNYTNYQFTDTASQTYYWGATNGMPQYTASAPGETGFYINGRNPVLNHRNAFARINLMYRLHENHKLNLTSLYTDIHIKGHDKRGIETFGADILANPQSMNKSYAGLALESKFRDEKVTNILSVKNFSGNSKVVILSETNIIKGEKQNSYSQWGYGDAIKIRLTQGMCATLNYEYTHRFPDKEELFGDFITVFPNAALEPEKSQNINIGLRYNTPLKKFTADINGFYRNTSNLIFLNSLSYFKSVYMNLLATETYGIEGEIKYAPIKNFNLYVNMTWQDIRLKDVDTESGISERYIGARIPNTPWLFGNTGINYILPWYAIKSNKIQVFYTCNYVHAFYLSWEIDGLESTKAVIPQQIVHNGGVSYIFLKDKLSLSLESRNFTNEKIYDNYKVQKPGRSFYAKLRLFLDK